MKGRSKYVVIRPHFNPEHCREARKMLGWSSERLAEESGVSVAAIEGYEAETLKLKAVTRQALAFRLEAEGLVFIDGYRPLIGDNVRGCTGDPRTRGDFHLVE